jgi:hypothetical protein
VFVVVIGDSKSEEVLLRTLYPLRRNGSGRPNCLSGFACNQVVGRAWRDTRQRRLEMSVVVEGIRALAWLGRHTLGTDDEPQIPDDPLLSPSSGST